MSISNFLKKLRKKSSLEDIEIPANLSGRIESKSLIELKIGEIDLPTGSIIASDPFFTHSYRPFARKVPPGRYPVYISVLKIREGHHRIAFSRIKFKAEKVTKWIQAIPEEFDLAKLNGKSGLDYVGFKVNAGLGCFIDEKVNEKYLEILDNFSMANPDTNYYDGVLASEFIEYSGGKKYSGDLGDWNIHQTDDGEGSIAMFSSGWGEGYYPCYWGLNRKKEIVELAVDFLLAD